MFSAVFWAQDGAILRENISITTAKIQLANANFKPICEIKTDDNILDELSFLRSNQYEILECFMSQKTLVKQSEQKSNQNFTKNIQINIIPTRFIIEFKPNLAIIGILNYKAK